MPRNRISLHLKEKGWGLRKGERGGWRKRDKEQDREIITCIKLPVVYPECDRRTYSFGSLAIFHSPEGRKFCSLAVGEFFVLA